MGFSEMFNKIGVLLAHDRVRLTWYFELFHFLLRINSGYLLSARPMCIYACWEVKLEQARLERSENSIKATGSRRRIIPSMLHLHHDSFHKQDDRSNLSIRICLTVGLVRRINGATDLAPICSSHSLRAALWYEP